MNIPDCKEFIKGCKKFKELEKRDAMYNVAFFLVAHFWGNPSNMADGLGVLLLTWNRPFYQYGNFDFNKLEECINNNFEKIKNFRNRKILSLSSSDENDIKDLFYEFLEALQIAREGKTQGRKSPVAVSKALHLLAPGFFPLWDYKIARAYGYDYNESPAEKYILFCKDIRCVAGKVEDCITQLDKRFIELKDYTRQQGTNKTLIKLIDEYNYLKYTKEWI